MHNIGKIILISGLVLVVLGGLIWAFGNIFSWFGNLPGDIRIKRENLQVYIPITSMILLSAILSFVFWLIRRFL
ncbi:MAG: DUF2905 domain-containing protein [Bacteroidales bacterium]|nr:DUF2905 domain-containing protein [Bacteroidales bacterium]